MGEDGDMGDVVVVGVDVDECDEDAGGDEDAIVGEVGETGEAREEIDSWEVGEKRRRLDTECDL